jgi:Ca-activated chloride channel family protein
MKFRAFIPRVAVLMLAILAGWVLWSPGQAQDAGSGALTVIEPDGKTGRACPLEHTSVKAEVSGFLARVTVTQVFHNPLDKKIEAVYTFPLSADGAVDDMVMLIGDRTVRGVIKRREEARQIYEQAKQQGHVAALLDQERPNIFTQSVANIMPGEKVKITISYVELLAYDDGAFKFVFPMVVGPRFIPGAPAGKQGTGWAKDTPEVPDASRITPPVAPEGARAGHDIDLAVSIDAGVPIESLDSKLHEVDVQREGKTRAQVSLKTKKEIPNRDFVLTYQVAGDQVRSGVLTHKDGNEGYATVVIIPPKRVQPADIAGKEMIFVIDCSGSQAGWPLQKAKEAMRYFIDRMNPNDTFNIVDFNVGSRMLFNEPKPNTPANRETALNHLKSLEARGGTWMGPAVEAVCKTSAPENRLRIVTFMTDGYVGNDMEIIDLVKRLRGASRWFPFGTGNSVNRFLLDNMARVGGGEVEYILLNTPGEAAAKAFYERIAAPVLTDISMTTEGIKLEDVFPKEVSDLWSRKPLVFKARYTKAGEGRITIKGFHGGRPYQETLNVALPDKETRNASLGSLWARAKVDALMDQDLAGIQRGTPKPDVKEEIIKVALAHRIMTQFTSFVAVEEKAVTDGGSPTTVAVPVEMPEGVSREGVFGKREASVAFSGAPMSAAPVMAPQAPARAAAKQATRSDSQSLKLMPMPSKNREPVEVHGVQGLKSEDERSAGKDKEEGKADNALAKLSPDLSALLKDKSRPMNLTLGKIKVVNGKVIVRVRLSENTEEVVQLLKEAGLEILSEASSGKTVAGVILVDKLEELVKLAVVESVEPDAGE